MVFATACTNNTSSTTKFNKSIIEKDTCDATNNFYDNEKTYLLSGNDFISVSGEIENPGKVNYADLPLHSLIVKETVLQNSENKFIGAYRYDGYSLSDIINKMILDKKNKDDFRPIIDLYIEIKNDNGESVVFSWGELYYPIHRHEIIIATRVMNIVPSKTKEQWTLPTERKIIVASDLLTERNISNPTKIIIKSLDCKYKVDREIELHSETVSIKNSKTELTILKQLPKDLQEHDFPSIFYGRGRGIHGVTPFKGGLLKDLLADYYSIGKDDIKNGMIVIAAKDGYRSAFTVSEIFNRNDQSEVMIIDHNNYQSAGKFSLFCSGDFFSDRAISAISEIRFLNDKR